MAIWPKRMRHLTQRQREERNFYLFIAPWLAGFVLFTGGPVLYSFLMSLTNWTGIQTRDWVGFDNYVQLFTTDPLFWTVMKNTFVYGFFSVLFGTVLALGVAILLNQKVPGISIFRTFYYLPSVTSGIATMVLGNGKFLRQPVASTVTGELSNLIGVLCNGSSPCNTTARVMAVTSAACAAALGSADMEIE